MAFQIPKHLPKKGISVSRDPTLPTFSFSNVTKEEELGRGSFGVVYKARYQSDIVVIKQLHVNDWNQNGKKIVKEAKIINSLKNECIIRFLGVSYSPLAMMLEYACFDFSCLGGSMKLSAMNEFFKFVDIFAMKSLESFSLKMAKDVTSGLLYLHKI